MKEAWNVTCVIVRKAAGETDFHLIVEEIIKILSYSAIKYEATGKTDICIEDVYASDMRDYTVRMAINSQERSNECARSATTSLA